MGRLLDLYKAIASQIQTASPVGRLLAELAQQVSSLTSFAAGEVTALAGRGLVPNGTALDVGQNVDNSIVVNENDVQLNPALQAEIASSTATAASNTAIISGSGISPIGGFGYLTQTDWAVNPQTGNDANAGTSAAPLQSLAELSRRWRGRTFSPAISAVNVTLSGTFAVTDNLILAGATFTAASVLLTVQGTMTTVDSGTITAFTAMSPSTGVRAALTDAAQDFTPYIRTGRVRMTSGAANTAVTYYGSLGGGVTVANVGQFWANSAFSGTSVNPAPGDSYVIENYTTIIQRYLIDLAGPVTTLIRDIQFGAQPIVSDVTYCGFTQQADRLKNKIYGCRYNIPGFAVILLHGNQALLGCVITGDTPTNGGFQFKLGQFGENGCCWFAASQMIAGANVEGQHNMHDGNGTMNVSRIVQNLSLLEDFNHRGFFGNINGLIPQHIQLNDGAEWTLSSSSGRFWGAAGNTVTTALRILNSSGMTYVTLPTATGVAPGSDVILANAAAIPWASLPAAAAPPNNAYAVVRQ